MKDLINLKEPHLFNMANVQDITKAFQGYSFLPNDSTNPTETKIDPSANQTPAPIEPKNTAADTFSSTLKNIGNFKQQRLQDIATKIQPTQSNNTPTTNGSTDEFSLFRDAIAKRESSNNYTSISPNSPNGDRAYGKYQVMGNNIPSWTKEALGQALTPQQFLQSQDAQDKVFEYRVKQLYKQYGNWGDVAAVWFSGRPLAGNTSKDVLGTSVPQYVKDVLGFMKANPQNNQSVKIASAAKKTLGTITTPFGGSTKYEAFHPGIDIAAPIGTKIPAFSGGKVTEVVSGKKQGDPGFGNYIVVTDDKGNKWRYSHLSQQFIKLGDMIQKGQIIGGMGNTGSTYSTSGGSGSHLDLRIQDAASRFLNPATLL